MLERQEEIVELFEIVGDAEFQQFLVVWVFDFGVGRGRRIGIFQLIQRMDHTSIAAVHMEQLISLVRNVDIVMVGILDKLFGDLSQINWNLVIAP